MCKTSLHFRVSSFRSRVLVWALLAALSWSFLPSLSAAQQPTATISTLSGTVLVNAQEQGIGTVLNPGDVIETQAGATVVLELSDGSLLELGENTKLDIAVLSQTAVGARVSRLKLLWGRIRAFLSPQHQIEGSSFDIETPNALIGVKFSEPDIEVSYNQEKAETVGIAHTVELMAKNLLTNEEVLVPVGSTVIITAVGMKVVAGIVGIGGASSAGSTGTGTASTTTSTGSAGMGTGTNVAIGVGAAAAVGGVAAVAASSGGSGDGETAESTGDLSGIWDFDGSCVAQGCTEDIPCPLNRPDCCGTKVCDCCEPNWFGPVTQTGNMLQGAIEVEQPYGGHFLNGSVDGNSVSFAIETDGIIPLSNTTNYIGVIDGNIIRGTFSGSTYVGTPSGNVLITWSGTFTVTIRKE